MGNETAVVILNIKKKNGKVETHDLEIPLFITAHELVVSLNSAYRLGIDTENVKKCYIKTENPIALLRGNKLLSEYNVMNGTKIMIAEGEL